MHRLLLLFSITAPLAACAHPDTDPVATCGALPQDACTEADCALSPGDDGYGVCAGHAVYDCVDGAWTGTRCEVDILVADGTWQLSYAATLPAGCPAVTLPASLTVDADQPAGTQDLTPSAADATFDDVSYLVAFDHGSASYAMNATWSGPDGAVTVSLDHALSLRYDGTITGTATGQLGRGGVTCTATFDVTGTFSPGWSPI
ncbi:MAG: hypothetical protein H6709_11445 [Kofleriaceae bacterium]|nr:hypothetical protein [Kofleriaceae bacterium]MCB9572689.1 hypothetical protein [Kofleriaceae bacterium]